MAAHWYVDASLPEFDAFGHPVSEEVARSIACPALSSAENRNARSLGLIFFWSLVIALLAGRVYVYEKPLLHTSTEHGERSGSI